MTKQAERQMVKVATIDWNGDPDTWADVCQEAYDEVKAHLPTHLHANVTPLEPYGTISGAFRWRTYLHNHDGSVVVYAEIQRVPGWINLDEVVRLLEEVHSVPAFVEQTGGGVASIMAGDSTHRGCTCGLSAHLAEFFGVHQSSCSAHRPQDRWFPAIAGPGTYGAGLQRPSDADLCDFYVGVDDEGASDPISFTEVGARDERAVAKLIAAQAAKTDRQPLTTDEVEALGFDGTGRS